MGSYADAQYSVQRLFFKKFVVNEQVIILQQYKNTFLLYVINREVSVRQVGIMRDLRTFDPCILS